MCVQQIKWCSILNSFCVILSLDSPEESSIEAESEAMVYREPTQYQNLLVSLGSSNKVVADMNKRRYLYNVVCFNKFKSSVFGLFGSL